MKRILAGLLLAVCAACASFRGEELTRIEDHELREGTRLPAVTYELDDAIGGPMPFHAGSTGLCVERVFGPAFADLERKESAEGLHLKLRYVERTRQPVFSMGLGLLTIFTLGLIPTYEYDDVNLSVRVEVDGVLARRYEYQDHVDTWIHLFMIPWAFSHDPREVHDEVLENMLLHFLRDFRRDLPGFLEPAAA